MNSRLNLTTVGSVSPWLWGVVVIWAQFPFIAITYAESPSVSDEDIDQLIEHLVTIIKGRQNDFAEIQIEGEIKITSTGEVVKVRSKTYQGSVISKTEKKIIFKTIDGMRFEVRRKHVERLDQRGHFQGENMKFQAHGGRTALATLALLSAGCSRHDPVVSSALHYLKKHPMPGTYGRALRASIYSLLVQQAPSKREKGKTYGLLRRDARWLLLAMTDLGGFTYRTYADSQRGRRKPITIYDNSNSQFGTLGLWISALAGYDVPTIYWEKIEQFWMSQQLDDGGWGYKANRSSTENMTIAGINSLIIVLDQLYARHSGKYVKFKGIEKNDRRLAEIRRVEESIQRAQHWLAVHGRPYGQAYTQLGTERLGLASGEKYLGNRDWYRAGAIGAMNYGSWEMRRIEYVSMWLLFLAHGRAPVLINKLNWGDEDSGWNYYYRDLHHACRFLSNTYEQLYKWQIIDTKSTLYDLEDAPFLYISGEARFWLPQGISAKVKEYVLSGGTVMGHANLASKEFANTFKKTFERMFAEYGLKFRKLPFDHSIYGHPFGKAERRFKIKVPIWALSDGYREIVFLFPVDIAGAWHQSLDEKYVDFFRLFANVRYHAARGYQELPGRLRSRGLPGQPSALQQTLRIARPVTAAYRGGALTVWETVGKLMEHYYGISLDVDRRVLLANINEADDYDLVHITGQGCYQFAPEEISAIDDYCKSGGLLLIEALGGDEEFAQCARQQLNEMFNCEPAAVKPGHDVMLGKFQMGKPLRNLRLTPAARNSGFRPSDPVFYEYKLNDRCSVLFSVLDLSVSANGHYVRKLRGYNSLSSQIILRNVLLFRLSEIH